MDPSVAFQHINWLAVVAAAASTFVIGGLWYGPVFGKTWMRLTGIAKGTPGQNSMGPTFGECSPREHHFAQLICEARDWPERPSTTRTSRMPISR